MTVFLTLVLALLVCVRVTVSCIVSVWLRAQSVQAFTPQSAKVFEIVSSSSASQFGL